ncbi:MAG: hypothetical protein EZS28_006570 [Streblomastix strix]|uniref:Uncharacterized protein n=1 Tax=Streblomastix strix TaxID=222440 RepID=A0A5J4WS28_9EUKA|nr:MAG: hypothetical protein EZS28_006570 [Streblomastix strix]
MIINSQDHALQLISNIIDQSRDYNFFFGFTDPGIVQSNVLLSKQISDQQPPDNNNHKKKTIIPAQLQVNKSVGFLSTILPPQSVEQLALICAERCANEGRISSAVGLLLDTPGAEERGFIICDSFLSTFLLKQVHDHPQRRFILSKIQTYLNSRGFENIDQVQQTKNIILLSMSICILIGEASEQVDQLIGQDYQEQISQMNADQIRSGWERVIDLIDKSSIIPKTSEEIKLKLPLFINIQDQQQQQFEPQTNLLNCITNNIPEILILYSTALFELYKITKQESGQIFGSFGEQNTDYSQYQKRVHTAVTFAGHLPQDTIGDAHARMQQILVSME